MYRQTNLDAWLPQMQQAVFRHLLHAFSYPGHVAPMPAGDNGARLLVLAALLDSGATLADPDALIDPHVHPLLEARSGTASQARFVVARGDLAPRFTPAVGTLASPEHGATIVLCVEHIGDGDMLHLSGPGCDGVVPLRVQGLDPGWLSSRAQWNAGFPMGVDMILVDACQMAALPRTTRIERSAAGRHN